MFIPTVALYNDNPHGYPFWAEFHPVPIAHGMNDKGILKAGFETSLKRILIKHPACSLLAQELVSKLDRREALLPSFCRILST